jgi:hypothetical protein
MPYRIAARKQQGCISKSVGVHVAFIKSNPLLYHAATWTSAFINYTTKRIEQKRIYLQRVKENKRKREANVLNASHPLSFPWRREPSLIISTN